MSGERSTAWAVPQRTNGFAAIGDYGAIGDGHVLALVASDGSIDWMCAPSLDSPSVFGALVAPERGGRFELRPTSGCEVARSYVEDSNVLQTTMRTSTGTVRISDALSRPGNGDRAGRELVRVVEGLAGEVPVRWRLEPRFDYAQRQADVAAHGDAWILGCGSPLRLGVQSWDAGDAAATTGGVGAEFVAREGTRALIAAAIAEGPLLFSSRPAIEGRLEQTIEYWRRWVGRAEVPDRWSGAVRRGLLTLALLADARTGAITAAGTTSLPEAIGGSRNFDYRFAWVRDLSFTLDVLLRVGLDDVVERSFHWLLDATAHTHPRVDPVYRLAGAALRHQDSLPLPGYRGSTPVHVGNEAGSQLQLGGFGDLLDTAWLFTQNGGVLDAASGQRLADVVDLLASIWGRRDSGLWELGRIAQYGSSKLGCWAAFDRALRLAAANQIPGRHASRWRTARDAVRSYIERELYSSERGSYVQMAGSDTLDAAWLLAARRGFVEPDSDRMSSTIDAIRSELGAGGPLLYRYTGMRTQENAFLACSFWLVEALARSGRFDEASEAMDALVLLGSDIGLYSEEIDPTSHALLGNFPQALTHLSLINAAVLFNEALERAGQAARGPQRQGAAAALATKG